MTKLKVTKTVEEGVICSVAGDDVLKLVDYLRGKTDVSEFIIAKDLDIDIQVIRNQLYRLVDRNLVTFWRKKDKQKGWYIYYWTYNPTHIEFLYWDIRKKRLEKLKERLDRETSDFFFMCKDNGCVRLDFEKAIEFNYQCPECGGMMLQQDNNRTKENLLKEIAQVEEELSQRE
jgi:transcription initiation factor TFIIE subunit alpha